MNKELPNFLPLFRRVRKVTKSDCWLRHVRPRALVEQLGSHWTDFRRI